MGPRKSGATPRAMNRAPSRAHSAVMPRPPTGSRPVKPVTLRGASRENNPVAAVARAARTLRTWITDMELLPSRAGRIDPDGEALGLPLVADPDQYGLDDGGHELHGVGTGGLPQDAGGR